MKHKKKLCSHCKITCNEKFCNFCQKIPRCKVCGIFIGSPDKKRQKIVYSVAFPSKKKGRCKDCENYEERIKNICFSCEDPFLNSEYWFKVNGNYCKKCN